MSLFLSAMFFVRKKISQDMANFLSGLTSSLMRQVRTFETKYTLVS